MDREKIVSWPPDLQCVFAAIGQVINGKRLHLDQLRSLSSEPDRILAGHRVMISHISGKNTGKRKGHYTIAIVGPRVDGQWHLQSGELERLSRAAAAATC
jgi:hypothetical protein